MHLKEKSCKNNHEALQKTPVVYPYPLEFDNLRYTQMRSIPYWLPKSMGGGDKWSKCRYFCKMFMVLIYSLEIHFSPANHLKSNHNRFFEGLKLLQKRQKLTKKSGKSGKIEFTISRENAPVAKLNKTESSPLTLFSQMTHSWWKVRKKYMSENFFVLEDRTTLIRRRIDVMVGSPSKKSRRTWNICGFLVNCWWQAWLSPIQHEQSPSQHYELNQKTSILKCKFANKISS